MNTLSLARWQSGKFQDWLSEYGVSKSAEFLFLFPGAT